MLSLRGYLLSIGGEGAIALTSDLKIQRQTTVERVADVLRGQILGGGLPPGKPLLELEIASKTGVSRGSVRQAFGLLISEGLLSRDSYRSVVVSRPDSGDIREIFQARRVIELAAVDAAVKATPDEFGIMNRACQEFVDAVRSGATEAAHEADNAMHAALVAVLHSGRLSRLHSSLLAELRLALTATYASSLDPDDLVPRHREFMDLVHARRTSEARAHLQRRLDEAERRILAGFQPPT